jgi:hypothetical protein
VKKKLKSHLNKNLALITSSLSAKDKFRIFKDKKLKKNIRFILVDDQKILAARARLGLINLEAIIRHLEMFDNTGKTEGCGCALCRLKHREYQTTKLLNEKRKYISNLFRVGQSLKGKEYEIIQSPFNENYVGIIKEGKIVSHLDEQHLSFPEEISEIEKLHAKTSSEIQDVFRQEFDLKVSRGKLLKIAILPKDF